MPTGQKGNGNGKTKAKPAEAGTDKQKDAGAAGARPVEAGMLLAPPKPQQAKGQPEMENRAAEANQGRPRRAATLKSPFAPVAAAPNPKNKAEAAPSVPVLQNANTARKYSAKDNESSTSVAKPAAAAAPKDIELAASSSAVAPPLSLETSVSKPAPKGVLGTVAKFRAAMIAQQSPAVGELTTLNKSTEAGVEEQCITADFTDVGSFGEVTNYLDNMTKAMVPIKKVTVTVVYESSRLYATCTDSDWASIRDKLKVRPGDEMGKLEKLCNDGKDARSRRDLLQAFVRLIEMACENRDVFMCIRSRRPRPPITEPNQVLTICQQFAAGTFSKVFANEAEVSIYDKMHLLRAAFLTAQFVKEAKHCPKRKCAAHPNLDTCQAVEIKT